MRLKKIAIALLSAILLLSATACGDHPTETPEGEETLYRETFAKETYVVEEGYLISLADGLPLDYYSPDSPTGAWLEGCATSDRDDYFDAYVLRHESIADGNTTFTYLVYYPHGGSPLDVTHELLKGESGYVLNLHYTVGEVGESDSLCYLTLTLPTGEPPRLRLLVGDEALGILSTVTETPIS